MDYIIPIVLIYSAAREIIFIVTVNKLVNKLMSRSYHEYQLAESVGKPPQKAVVLPHDELFEDFGAVM